MIIPGKPVFRRAALAALLSLLLAACATVGAPPDAASDTKMLRVANGAAAEGDPATAAKLYRELLDRHPKEGGLHLVLGRALLAMGDSEAAIAELATAVTLLPNASAARLALGKAQLARHLPADAIQSFETALTLAPHSAPALNGLGVALDEIGRHGDAQGAYAAARQIAPGDPAILNNLGLSLALSGRYEEAIALLSGLVQDGGTPRNRQNLALALALKGDAAASARVARVDLDAGAVASNLGYVERIRQLTAANTGPLAAPAVAQR